MRTVVTGAAGFIGSNLTDRLLADGHDVVGIDRLSDYYDPTRKLANLESARGADRFSFVEVDLADGRLHDHLDGAQVVFHIAAQPGVRLSWADGFATYERDNVLGTQQLLDAAVAAGVQRVVYSSSSSIYGNAARYPSRESDAAEPHSPYGVTKLAGEHLCRAYESNWGMSTVALRYFTVYGPRQRPDMSVHRLISCAASGEAFPLFGDGSFSREFTFVDDIVDATIRAATAEVDVGTAMNVAGGATVQMSELISLVEEVTGKSITRDERPAAPGDVARNGGSTELARRLLGWSPRVALRDGVEAQVSWQLSRSARATPGA